MTTIRAATLKALKSVNPDAAVPDGAGLSAETSDETSRIEALRLRHEKALAAATDKVNARHQGHKASQQRES